MIELIFDGLLRGSAAVSALAVGGIYPATLPKDLTTWPAIHYLFIGGTSTATQDTYGNQKLRVEVNCWANSYFDAVTLRKAVVAALAQYNQGGVFIQLIQPRDLFDYEILEFRAIAEFYVFSNFNPNS
jgi:Protein of unknown function (DUF3168)